MLKLIPKVKHIEVFEGKLSKKAIFFNDSVNDDRLRRAISLLPSAENGAPLKVENGDLGEGYEIWINAAGVRIKGDGPEGVFYAIQTLRQIFNHPEVPYLYIKDKPDFKYRGFYHDVTRGKVPTVARVKQLIDQMSFFKLNSLQLYVEHTYEFEETKDIIQKTGYLTSEELKEIGAYCKENFIEFIPSLSTFGHLFELLNQDKFKHLRVLGDYEAKPNRWLDRMEHHTIDPLKEESFEVVKSLIDQYLPNFQSDYFNICCDETFDLIKVYGQDAAKLYVDFVKKIIAYLQSKGKKIMMWADILLTHPETISELPEDVCFLNWRYRTNPDEEQFAKLGEMGRKQIVCPGTTVWNRFCEQLSILESNITKVIDFGNKHGAVGVLNTSWGDYGHTCSLELTMYGMTFGAAKSWDLSTATGDEFDACVDLQLYKHSGAMATLRELSALSETVSYRNFVLSHFAEDRTALPADIAEVLKADIGDLQKAYLSLCERLLAEKWVLDDYRVEMMVAAEAICLVAELYSLREGKIFDRVTDTEEWLKKYRTRWMLNNKESELSRIENFFKTCETEYKK